MTKLISIIITVSIIWFIFSLIKGEPEIWIGYYYPNIENMEYFHTSSTLDSLEECRNWVDDNIKVGDNYDYECGLNCKMHSIGVPVCEETVQ